MRGLSTLAAIALTASADVYVPHKEHDLNNYRSIPLMPNVWLEGTTRYVMFANDEGEYTLTMEAKMDNNNGGPVESDGVNGAGRGIFFQDATYGYEALDGWVVTYDAVNYEWDTTSLLLSYSQYDFADSALDLTAETPNTNWDCEVELDPAPSPTYEFVRCSRLVPDVNDYTTLSFRYQPYIVVNAIGYKYWGWEQNYSMWSFGGLITMENANYLVISSACVISLLALNLF